MSAPKTPPPEKKPDAAPQPWALISDQLGQHLGDRLVLGLAVIAISRNLNPQGNAELGLYILAVNEDLYREIYTRLLPLLPGPSYSHVEKNIIVAPN